MPIPDASAQPPVPALSHPGLQYHAVPLRRCGARRWATNASQEDKDSYNCWMIHYLDHCNKKLSQDWWQGRVGRDKPYGRDPDGIGMPPQFGF